MPNEVDVTAMVDHARGVIAERFGVGIETADAILSQVSQTQRCGLDELAAAVVASCSEATLLPRQLHPLPGGTAA